MDMFDTKMTDSREEANDDSQTMGLYPFIHHLPKVELHAHLNGCIRQSTLLELAKERNVKLSTRFCDSNDDACADHTKERTMIDSGDSYDDGSAAASGGIYNNNNNNKRGGRSLSDCFAIFAEIVHCVDDVDALRRITREALEDFASHHVAYLELRSTPKCLWTTTEQHRSKDDDRTKKCTKRDYVEIVWNVMHSFALEEHTRYTNQHHRPRSNSTGVVQRQQHPNNDGSSSVVRLALVPRFIVSIDRSGTLHDAMEHVSIAVDLFKAKNPYVVGVDLGGNPFKNDFRQFESAFQFARESGLSISIHCGEIACGQSSNEESNISLKTAFEEASAILQFKPDRLGHALLLPNSMMDELVSLQIPIECCPTSNVMTLDRSNNTHSKQDLVEGLRRSHPHLKHWIECDYPISINTDDPGIFHTNPTQELLLLAQAFQMDEVALSRIVLQSLNHIFERSPEVTSSLKHTIENRISDLLQKNVLRCKDYSSYMTTPS